MSAKPRGRFMRSILVGIAVLLVVVACAVFPVAGPKVPEPAPHPEPTWDGQSQDLREELKKLPARIIYETYNQGNWELAMVCPDGSAPVNLTRTGHIDELYPHVSPGGTKVCFVDDEGHGSAKVRSVYHMKTDGTGRTLVDTNARQPCWSPDGRTIAYLKGEFARFCYKEYATKNIFFHDLQTGKNTPHPNDAIEHLYNIRWSPDGKWFLATVHGGMGYDHAIIAIEVDGMNVFKLGIDGCRPDISPDGKRIAWNASNWSLCVAEIDLNGLRPRITNKREIVTSPRPMKVYHVEFSPDGRYVAFSRGPSQRRLGHVAEIVGIPAEGWDICVADASPTAKNRWVRITADRKPDKEPDWVPLADGK